MADAALGAVFGELLKEVQLQITQITNFKSTLKRLEGTLTTIKPYFDDMAKLSKVLDHYQQEPAMFTEYLEVGKDLVSKCSKVRWWNPYSKLMYAKRLIRLDNKLLRYFQMEGQAITMVYTMRTLSEIQGFSHKVDNGHNIRLSIPGCPEFIIGFDRRLEDVKCMLFKDETRILLISAPGGCGKTTLAKMLCHDHHVKDRFGDNILYVTVSRGSNLQIIAKKLCERHGIGNCEFQTDEEAKNEIECLLQQRQMRSDKKNMLLVLDDVWLDSESLVEDLKFQIPGYKILVTSRFLFQRFNNTYELRMMNDMDAECLFRYHAFSSEIPVSVPDDIVNKIVTFCKGLPLALTLVGASLCGQPMVKWKNTLKKLYEGQSILQLDSRVRRSLETSLDTLDDFPIVRDCFFDFGLFPEDDRIEGTILEDMWLELYNLAVTDEGMCSENLLELASRNLVSLVPIRYFFGNQFIVCFLFGNQSASCDLCRKYAGEVEGYCNEYYVTQHDLLRDLAIDLSGQEPVEQRQRLFTEINENEFPIWWVEQPVQSITARILSNLLPWWFKRPIQSINARIVSISTDESFSSDWHDHDLDAPNVQVLKLNIRSKEYTLPHFISRMSQLKVLIVTGYGDYPVQLHNLQVIGSLPNLRRIRFEHVSLSHSIQSIFKLQCLWKLTFVTCKIGDALNGNDSPDMLPSLTVLEFDHCYDLKELPTGICSLNRLQKLIITNCQELDPLPGGLGSLSNLEILRLHGCTKLEKLPESIGSLHDLSLLDISDCLSIRVLPEQIGELSGLRVVNMSGCHGLGELPVSLRKLLQLERVICDEETSHLWKTFGSDIHLRNLKIDIVEEDRHASFMKIHQ